MSLRFHEIAEAGHRILNPFSAEKLRLLGEICRIAPGTRQLDLACGKGELLSSWSSAYGLRGVGVDISHVFLDAARERAAELGVAEDVEFVQGDAGAYDAGAGTFDIVSCIGATWIGGGLAGTLGLMRRPLKADGLVLVGEPYWSSEPPPGYGEDLKLTSLAGIGEVIERAGFELVEMVLGNQDDWDRYAASQWLTLSDWIRANPADPEIEQVKAFLDSARRSYLEWQRPHLGWGVFVLRPAAA
ncbi:SAM-dependent methyltransferase [Nonomuraea sp. NPDC050328]|uniref:SAM-dependent methyltransferase n=1 Tax=Nonomuraea sp. NPDC050328 TaxID=3364361 RepID=UPI00378B6CE9